MEELERARKIIDEADGEMAKLFCRRMEAAKEIAAYKGKRGLPVFDPSRENAVLAAGGALLLFRPHFEKIGKMLPLCLLYVAVLSAMFALGFPLACTAGTSALPITAGALLFYASDLLVAKNVFLSSSKRSEAAAMTTYYAAEFLFALSAYLAAF